MCLAGWLARIVNKEWCQPGLGPGVAQGEVSVGHPGVPAPASSQEGDVGTVTRTDKQLTRS